MWRGWCGGVSTPTYLRWDRLSRIVALIHYSSSQSKKRDTPWTGWCLNFSRSTMETAEMLMLRCGMMGVLHVKYCSLPSLPSFVYLTEGFITPWPQLFHIPALYRLITNFSIYLDPQLEPQSWTNLLCQPVPVQVLQSILCHLNVIMNTIKIEC